MHLYYPYSQRTHSILYVAVRTSGDPGALVPVRRTIRSIDPRQPVYQVTTMADLLGRSLGQRRFSTALLASPAAVALLLAAIGVYGVLSYALAQRTVDPLVTLRMN